MYIEKSFHSLTKGVWQGIEPRRCSITELS